MIHSLEPIEQPLLWNCLVPCEPVSRSLSQPLLKKPTVRCRNANRCKCFGRTYPPPMARYEAKVHPSAEGPTKYRNPFPAHAKYKTGGAHKRYVCPIKCPHLPLARHERPIPPPPRLRDGNHMAHHHSTTRNIRSPRLFHMIRPYSGVGVAP